MLQSGLKQRLLHNALVAQSLKMTPYHIASDTKVAIKYRKQGMFQGARFSTSLAQIDPTCGASAKWQGTEVMLWVGQGGCTPSWCVGEVRQEEETLDIHPAFCFMCIQMQR